MEIKEILQQFAKENNINKSKVDDFLKNQLKCKTLSDLLKLPHSEKRHGEWISSFGRGFIYNKLQREERYSTVKLDTLVEWIEWDFNDLEEDIKEYEVLTVDELKKRKNGTDLDDAIDTIIELIESKFGSCVIDW